MPDVILPFTPASQGTGASSLAQQLRQMFTARVVSAGQRGKQLSGGVDGQAEPPLHTALKRLNEGRQDLQLLSDLIRQQTSTEPNPELPIPPQSFGSTSIPPEHEQPSSSELSEEEKLANVAANIDYMTASLKTRGEEILAQVAEATPVWNVLQRIVKETRYPISDDGKNGMAITVSAPYAAQVKQMKMDLKTGKLKYAGRIPPKPTRLVISLHGGPVSVESEIAANPWLREDGREEEGDVILSQLYDAEQECREREMFDLLHKQAKAQSLAEHSEANSFALRLPQSLVPEQPPAPEEPSSRAPKRKAAVLEEPMKAEEGQKPAKSNKSNKSAGKSKPNVKLFASSFPCVRFEMRKIDRADIAAQLRESREKQKEAADAAAEEEEAKKALDVEQAVKDSETVLTPLESSSIKDRDSVISTDDLPADSEKEEDVKQEAMIPGELETGQSESSAMDVDLPKIIDTTDEIVATTSNSEISEDLKPTSEPSTKGLGKKAVPMEAAAVPEPVLGVLSSKWIPGMLLIICSLNLSYIHRARETQADSIDDQALSLLITLMNYLFHVDETTRILKEYHQCCSLAKVDCQMVIEPFNEDSISAIFAKSFPQSPFMLGSAVLEFRQPGDSQDKQQQRRIVIEISSGSQGEPTSFVKAFGHDIRVRSFLQLRDALNVKLNKVLLSLIREWVRDSYVITHGDNTEIDDNTNTMEDKYILYNSPSAIASEQSRAVIKSVLHPHIEKDTTLTILVHIIRKGGWIHMLHYHGAKAKTPNQPLEEFARQIPLIFI